MIEKFAIFIFICLFIHLFIFGCTESLLLHRLSLVLADSRGYTLVVKHELLIAVASGVEHGLWGIWGSVVVASGFSICGSWAPQHGLSSALQHMGSTQTRDLIHVSCVLWMHPCLLNSLAKSLPLSHQWSLSVFKRSLVFIAFLLLSCRSFINIFWGRGLH